MVTKSIKKVKRWVPEDSDSLDFPGNDTGRFIAWAQGPYNVTSKYGKHSETILMPHKELMHYIEVLARTNSVKVEFTGEVGNNGYRNVKITAIYSGK